MLLNCANVKDPNDEGVPRRLDVRRKILAGSDERGLLHLSVVPYLISKLRMQVSCAPPIKITTSKINYKITEYLSSHPCRCSANGCWARIRVDKHHH